MAISIQNRVIFWLDLTKPSFDTQSFFKKYSNFNVVASQWLRLSKQNLHQLFIHIISYHCMWAYKFLMPYFWAAFFKQVITSGGNNRGGGWAQYRRIKCRRKMNEVQRCPLRSLHVLISPNWLRSLLASSLWSSSLLHSILTKPWQLNGANCPLMALTGLLQKANLSIFKEM